MNSLCFKRHVSVPDSLALYPASPQHCFFLLKGFSGPGTGEGGGGSGGKRKWSPPVEGCQTHSLRCLPRAGPPTRPLLGPWRGAGTLRTLSTLLSCANARLALGSFPGTTLDALPLDTHRARGPRELGPSPLLLVLGAPARGRAGTALSTPRPRGLSLVSAAPAVSEAAGRVPPAAYLSGR